MLVSLGFQRFSYDIGLYYSREREIYILVFVDDIIIIANSEDIDQLKRNLLKLLNIQQFHDAHYFLEAEIIRNREKRTLFLTQEAYADRLLKKHGMEKANSVATPLSNKLLRKPHPEDVIDVESYQSKLGGTQYLAIWTRPDFSFAQSELATFATCPAKEHHEAMQHLLRYLKGTKHYGLLFGAEDASMGLLRPYDYSDSDFARSVMNRKSVSGYVFLVNKATVFYTFRK